MWCFQHWWIVWWLWVIEGSSSETESEGDVHSLNHCRTDSSAYCIQQLHLLSVQIALVNKTNRTYWRWNCCWFIWNVRLQLNCWQVQIYLEVHYLHTCIKVTFYLIIVIVSLSGRHTIFMLCVSGTLNSFTQLSFFCNNLHPVPSETVDGGFTLLYNKFRLAVTCFIY
jgi:amino acid permease